MTCLKSIKIYFLGCINHPAPGERFCSLHKEHKSPVLTPNQISKESLETLNNEHSSQEKFWMTGLERDNVFVIEGLVSSKLYKDFAHHHIPLSDRLYWCQRTFHHLQFSKD